METLRAHSWPGNVRELQNILERAVITCRRGELKLDLAGGPGARENPVSQGPTGAEETAVLSEAEMKRRERENILRALHKSGGKIFGKNGAARLLGIKPTTLATRIQAMGLKKGVHPPFVSLMDAAARGPGAEGGLPAFLEGPGGHRTNRGFACGFPQLPGGGENVFSVSQRAAAQGFQHLAQTGSHGRSDTAPIPAGCVLEPLNLRGFSLATLSINRLTEKQPSLYTSPFHPDASGKKNNRCGF